MIKRFGYTILAGLILLLWGVNVRSCMSCYDAGGTPVRGIGPMYECMEKAP